MNKEQDLIFSKEHEWVLVKDNVATIGISDFAQQSLGDVVFIELPKIGTQLKQNQVIGSIESVKTVSDIYSPLSGEVIETNKELEQNPEILNSDPYNKAWIFKLKIANLDELKNLLNFEDYKKIL